jgi:hypothetical protein
MSGMGRVRVNKKNLASGLFPVYLCLFKKTCAYTLKIIITQIINKQLKIKKNGKKSSNIW